MIEHNCLELALCSDDLVAKGAEHRSNGCDVLVTASSGDVCVVPLESRRKIDLTGLIVNQETWNGMIWRRKEKSLKRKGDGNVIGKPICAAPDLPEIILSIWMNHPDR